MKKFEKIKENLFLYIKNSIDKENNKFLLFILFVLSVFFRGVIFFRNLAYDFLLRPKKTKIKVISIGNIVSGGTGKTPFTILLAKRLKKYKLAVISRGYRSKFENKSLVVGPESKCSAKDMGDEPYLLKKHLKTLIIVGKNKLLSIQKAEKLKCDIALLDDGFQCRKVKKDLEIVILNARDPFGKNRFLPRGYLRESPKSLKRADYIVINNASEKSEELEKKIRCFTDCPIIYTSPCPNKLLTPSKKEVKLKKGTKVAIFCGIAHPELFFSLIRNMGYEIVNFLYLLDHQSVPVKKLNSFVSESFNKGAEVIITTEKDMVKLKIKINCPILYIEIILKVIANNQNFESLVENIYLNS